MPGIDTSLALTQSVTCLKIVFSHPRLSIEEQFLWLWLVSQSVGDTELVCCLNYQQISQALGYSTQAVHRALLRLKLVGFLVADIPIHYGRLTTDMIKELRCLHIKWMY